VYSPWAPYSTVKHWPSGRQQAAALGSGCGEALGDAQGLSEQVKLPLNSPKNCTTHSHQPSKSFVTGAQVVTGCHGGKQQATIIDGLGVNAGAEELEEEEDDLP
jgi:hypothetical protein